MATPSAGTTVGRNPRDRAVGRSCKYLWETRDRNLAERETWSNPVMVPELSASDLSVIDQLAVQDPPLEEVQTIPLFQSENRLV
jgi:hypothetical protein